MAPDQSTSDVPLYRQDFSTIGRIIADDAEEIVALWYKAAESEQVRGRTTERKEMTNELVKGLRYMGEGLQTRTDEFLSRTSRQAASHGVFRWRSGWNVVELAKDFEILHRVTLDHIGTKHKDLLTYREVQALAMIFDLSIQRSIEAHAEEVRRREAEIQAKILQSNRDLEHFANIASHDLQEPLRMVTSFLGLLHKRLDTQLDQDSREWLNFALDGATRMSRMLTSLLAYARLGSHGVAPVRISADKALDEALLNVREAIVETGAAFERQPLPEVLYDPSQLVQVLQNLIANAIKYRRPETPPRIQIQCQRQDAWWVLSIRDNGIGLPPTVTSRVFDMFYQLDHGAERTGSGIGLAICKRIVERHGGRIWVESQEGQGATFFFTAPPVDPAPTSPPVTPSAPPPASS